MKNPSGYSEILKDRSPALDHMVKPGESILLAITFPAELPDSEACAAELMFDDFIAGHSCAGDWDARFFSILKESNQEDSQFKNAMHEAWFEAFSNLLGTTQLTHAVAKIEQLQKIATSGGQ